MWPHTVATGSSGPAPHTRQAISFFREGRETVAEGDAVDRIVGEMSLTGIAMGAISKFYKYERIQRLTHVGGFSGS